MGQLLHITSPDSSIGAKFIITWLSTIPEIFSCFADQSLTDLVRWSVMYRAVLELILMLFQLKQTSAKTRLLISFLFTAKSCARITQCQRNALLIVWFRREVYFYFLIHVVLGFFDADAKQTDSARHSYWCRSAMISQGLIFKKYEESVSGKNLKNA